MTKRAVACLILGSALTACHPKPPLKPQQAMNLTPAPTDAEPSLRDTYFHEVPDIALVHFDYNSVQLRSDARDVLKQNSAVLAKHPKWTVLVEGHCDERGTTTYNLALGSRRAAAVRQYYELMGIPGSRIATLSFGKEKPLCTDSDEACWSQNRRAATKVALKPTHSATL